MLMFCPTCANVLGVEEGPHCYRFSCSTCPYIQNIKYKISNKTYPKLKEVNLILRKKDFSAYDCQSLGRRRAWWSCCLGER